MSISQSLSIPLDDHENVFLKEYQGLSTNIISFASSDTESILEIISEKVCNRFDVVIHIDSYECHWHRGFQKLNIPHYVHVKYIDCKKKVLICDDPYFNVFQMELPFENFWSGSKTIRVYRYEPVSKNISADIIIDDIIEKTDINKINKDILSFAHRLLDVKTRNELFDYMDDIFFCTNVRNLKFIADSRYGLSYLFCHLSAINDKKPFLIDIAERFSDCGLSYEKVNNYYMKLYYRKSSVKEKCQFISDKLLEIAGMENGLYNQLSQLEEKS